MSLTYAEILAATIAEARRYWASRTPEQIAADKARDDREYRKWLREERQQRMIDGES